VRARRFARFRRGPLGESPHVSEVPDDGMCLSVFLVIEAPGQDGAVLLGRVDPAAPWGEIGGIDPARLAQIGERWMLPSRHLLLFESPSEAARGILEEQLGSPPIDLEGPFVFSDPYARAGAAKRDPHWDLHFVYRARWSSALPPPAPAWRRLEFVEVARTPQSEFARGQEYVLRLVGLGPRS
jgi:hypothetical protein